MERRRRRIRTEHRGVKLFRRQRSTGTVWLARWLDPDTGRSAELSLTALGLTSAEARRQWAITKSRTLSKRAAEIRAGIAPAAESWSIPEAVEDYLRRAGERLEKITVEGYRTSLARFLEWSKSSNLLALDQLSPAHLVSFKDWVSRVKKRRAVRKGVRGEHKTGKLKRSATSVNHDLLRTRIFLNEARKLGRAPLLDRDAITDSMSSIRGHRSRPSFLRAPEIQELLRACLRHDRDCYRLTRNEKAGDRAPGTTPKHKPAAPLVLFVLLSGCRSAEARALKWKFCYLQGASPELILPTSITKTKFERSVDLGVSPSLTQLLSALRLSAGGTDFVFGKESPVSSTLAKSIRRRLIGQYAAPRFTWQQLRQSCATFLVNAPGIYGGSSTWLSAKRLGHSVVIAENHYVGILRDVPRDAQTLEEAMGIADLAVKVVESVTPVVSRDKTAEAAS